MAATAVITGLGVAKSIGLFDWLFNWVEKKLDIPGTKTGTAKSSAVQAIVDTELNKLSAAGVIKYEHPENLKAYLDTRLSELKSSGGLGTEAVEQIVTALGGKLTEVATSAATTAVTETSSAVTKVASTAVATASDTLSKAISSIMTPVQLYVQK